MNSPYNKNLYNKKFHNSIEEGSLNSAREIVPLICFLVPGIKNILDIGCSTGSWLSVWKSHVEEIAGIDGSYVEIASLKFPKEFFTAADLSKKFDMQRRFDIVQSLEVAEHVEAAAADIFIENLVRHSDVILFSAAQRWQGGTGHINEQSPEYWQKKFAAHGYMAVDCIRPFIKQNKKIKSWYRFNSLIYVNQAGFARLTKEAQGKIVTGEKIKYYSDLSWNIRRALVRIMPHFLREYIAKIKIFITG